MGGSGTFCPSPWVSRGSHPLAPGKGAQGRGPFTCFCLFPSGDSSWVAEERGSRRVTFSCVTLLEVSHIPDQVSASPSTMGPWRSLDTVPACRVQHRWGGPLNSVSGALGSLGRAQSSRGLSRPLSFYCLFFWAGFTLSRSFSLFSCFTLISFSPGPVPSPREGAWPGLAEGTFLCPFLVLRAQAALGQSQGPRGNRNSGGLGG